MSIVVAIRQGVPGGKPPPSRVRLLDPRHPLPASGACGGGTPAGRCLQGLRMIHKIIAPLLRIVGAGVSGDPAPCPEGLPPAREGPERSYPAAGGVGDRVGGRGRSPAVSHGVPGGRGTGRGGGIRPWRRHPAAEAPSRRRGAIPPRLGLLRAAHGTLRRTSRGEGAPLRKPAPPVGRLTPSS
jgi:hypothetical protein